MRAIRDIKKSEEILISYFSADFTLAQRKKNLAAFQIECKCQLCLDQEKEKDKIAKVPEMEASAPAEKK